MLTIQRINQHPSVFAIAYNPDIETMRVTLKTGESRDYRNVSYGLFLEISSNLLTSTPNPFCSLEYESVPAEVNQRYLVQLVF